MSRTNRRSFLKRWLAFGGLSFLSGCDRLSRTAWFPKLLGGAETLTSAAQRALTSRSGMAREYSEAEIAPTFRPNGSTSPQTPEYLELAANEFRKYRLQVVGLVKTEQSLSLEELRAMPSRTQITRHDCVEGWSAIGKWKGLPLSALLDQAVLLPEARYVVFHCLDTLAANESPYYESIDLEDAYHPQSILAFDLNDQPLPIENGAPLRLRAERNLGYKMAKYIKVIELVQDFSQIQGGQGGYWEDRGYEWFTGI